MAADTPHPDGKTALLVLDVQHGIVEYAGSPEMVERVAAAIAAARAASVAVIFAKVGFRPGYPELGPYSPMYDRIVRSGRFVEGASSEIHESVAPQPDEVVVTRRRVSAFAGTDLEIVLRIAGIERLVLCGLSTSGSVLSTVRAAADLDYRLTVLSDGVADGGDQEVHRMLIDKVFARQATVQTVGEWTADVSGSR